MSEWGAVSAGEHRQKNLVVGKCRAERQALSV